jgi:hypothetical protein
MQGVCQICDLGEFDWSGHLKFRWKCFVEQVEIEKMSCSKLNAVEKMFGVIRL